MSDDGLLLILVRAVIVVCRICVEVKKEADGNKMDSNQLQLSQEDVTNLFIRWLHNPEYDNHSRYGYDIYLPSLIRVYLKQKRVEHFKIDNALTELSPLFYNAAWELCRRGIIRPGVSQYGAQETPDGSAGNGYAITPFGKQWLEESSNDDFVPTEPERFAQMLEPYKEQFGPGFHQRAQQAIRCYGAHAYLACCVMCGAAGESILLATGISKTKDAANILKEYSGRNGRQKIENVIIGKLNKPIQEEFKGHNWLLKYWRDEAAHGQLSNINENEAYTAVAQLLRFALFVKKNWNELTN